jgi:glycosyltransferase involved in cell wall biosynthesis
MTFSVSVVIPAFNVENFIEKAIKSALQQPEVNEVVVVNDGSTDNTLQILENLKNSDSKIKVYHHENKSNKGRSASRNLGILKASDNFIAFLDADDFYLNSRFKNDEAIFKNNKNIDGVYNAVGFELYREVTESELGKHKLSTVTKRINPDELFEAIVSSKYGYLHLNGLTIKKTVFDTVGLFNESLVVAEDSDIIFKMALKCKLESGIIDEPIASRGIHEDNIFTREDLYKKYNVKLFESLVNWSCKNGISLKNIDTLLNWLWFFKFKETNSLIAYLFYWIYLFWRNPKLLFSKLGVKYFPLVRLRQKLFSFLYNHKQVKS